MVLEYNWTNTRDLIEDVQAAFFAESLLFRSVLQSLARVGFELDPELRISYFKPSQHLYLYLGKVGELATSDLRLSDLQNGQLTLLVREACVSGSGSKQNSPFVTPVTKGTEDCP